MSSTAFRLSAADARRLLLHGAGLLHDPADAPTTQKIIQHLGFIQIDSINYIERAHELTLHARSDSYKRESVFRLLSGRKLFEHWTHDASLIPIEALPHWRFRFDRYRTSGWHLSRLGPGADEVIGQVLERVRKDGPLMSRHFEPADGVDGGRGGWWNWKPAKAALEYLWRTGQLAVSARTNFQKVYDVFDRAYPKAEALAAPSLEEHIDWACTSALQRLGAATPKEIADFYNAIKADAVRRWTDTALREGRVVPVEVESAEGARTSVALFDVKKRLSRLPGLPSRTRILAPFDPILRERARALRLFNFDYRFEAFVPAPKRKHGYYVLPVLEGDQLVTRLDARHDRATSTLHARIVGWEKGVRPTRERRRGLEEAVERLASFVGADHVALLKR